MRKVRIGIAAIGIAVSSIHASAAIEPQSGTVGASPSDQEPDAETNAKILKALLERRAALADMALPPASAGNTPPPEESRRIALEFLDNQIAKVRSEMAK